MFYPLLPLFLVGSLGVGKEIVGLIEGIAEATASLSKVVSGRLSDRAATRKPFLLASCRLPFFVRPLLALATSPWYVLSFRFVDRLGKGIRTAPRDTLITENTSKEVMPCASCSSTLLWNVNVMPSLVLAMLKNQ